MTDTLSALRRDRWQCFNAWRSQKTFYLVIILRKLNITHIHNRGFLSNHYELAIISQLYHLDGRVCVFMCMCMWELVNFSLDFYDGYDHILLWVCALFMSSSKHVPHDSFLLWLRISVIIILEWMLNMPIVAKWLDFGICFTSFGVI